MAITLNPEVKWPVPGLKNVLPEPGLVLLLPDADKTLYQPVEADIRPYLREWPTCPAGGTYEIRALGQSPICSFGNQLY